MASLEVEKLRRDDIVQAAQGFQWARKMPKWTVVVEGRELPARPLVLAAAGVAPNDPTNSHMAIAKLKELGFETRYAGEEHSGAAPVLKTTSDGRELTHRVLWKIVEDEARLAEDREHQWFGPHLVALVFAFHTVEAYLNYIGETIAPDIWKDERNFFRKEPYRGFEGKLRKVLELVGLRWSPESSPLKTVLELKTLRDLIAHGRAERIRFVIVHGQDEEIPHRPSTLRSLVIPRDKLSFILADVERLLNEIQTLAAPKVVGDPWFRSEALRGPDWYMSNNVTLNDVDD